MSKASHRFGPIFLAALLLLSVPFFGNGAFCAEVSSRQHLRSPINAGGPEDWPEDGALSTSSQDVARPAPTPSPLNEMPPATNFSDFPVQPASPLPATASGGEAPAPAASATQYAEPDYPPRQEEPANTEGATPAAATAPAPETQAAQAPATPTSGPTARGASSATHEGIPLGKAAEPKAEEPKPEPIYVDEAGNPVPKPPEPEKMLAEANDLMGEGKYDEALAVLDALRQIPDLDKNILETALYLRSDCIWARYADNPLAGYEAIVASTNEALNANLRSPHVPDALLRLALANARVGNLEEASGHVLALMRRFPDFPGVAQGLTVLGQEQLKKGLNAQAEKSFATVLDKYPESNQLQAASVGLSHALVNQGKDDRANIILDFISKRWPRYYINDPNFLLMHAANEEKLAHRDAALDLKWLFVNLNPRREGNDELLLQMGDDYLKGNNPQAADFVYREVEQAFPDTRSARRARLRLAEHGLYESPVTYAQMEQVFTRGQESDLWKIYNELADSSATEPEAIDARLKQAMWLLWDKQYTDAMGKAAEYLDEYPESAGAPAARDVLWQAFQKELANSLAEHNYGRILLLWNGFPLVRERYGAMDADLRYALAQGWKERGDDEKSFELMEEFLRGPMDPKYGEAVFSQFFNQYMNNRQWDKILELGKKVANWKMEPLLQNQLDYALALSAQNLGLNGPALAMWQKLAYRTDIPLYQQAYATYFLAKDAEQKRDIRSAYELNRKVVELFGRLADERSDKANPDRIKEAIASLMDICEVGNRIPEALEWAARYNPFAPEGSPEYPGLLFREARLHRKLGDNSRAEALLENIVKSYPDSPFAQAAAGELRTFEVTRDLKRFLPNQAAAAQTPAGTGSQDGNWSSSTPAATQNAEAPAQ